MMVKVTLPLCCLMFIFLLLNTQGTMGKENKKSTWSSMELFQLHRLNYKPFKTLYYNVFIQDKTCELQTIAPLDIFYVQNTSPQRPRLTLSKSSKEYFEANDVRRINPHQLEFSFKAYHDFSRKVKDLGPIQVQTENKNQSCHVSAQITYQKKKYQLKKIEIKFKLLLGFIRDVEFVRMGVVSLEKGRKGEKGEEMSICPTENCPP